jgi:hypothetical protein
VHSERDFFWVRDQKFVPTGDRRLTGSSLASPATRAMLGSQGDVRVSIAYRAICFRDHLCVLQNAEVKMDFKNA